MDNNTFVVETPLLNKVDPNFRDDLYKNRFLLRKHYENDAGNEGIEFKNNSQQSPIPDSVVHLNRYEKAYREKENAEIRKKLLAKVLRDFRAVRDNEISLKKGDIVIICKQIDFNWVEVEDTQSGLKGFVPRKYLDIEQEGLAKVIYNFTGKSSNEISLRKGETVKINRKIDDNWYEGVNMLGNVGIFPCSYVELVKNPLVKELEIENPVRTTTPIFRTLSPTNLTPQTCSVTRSVAANTLNKLTSNSFNENLISPNANLNFQKIQKSCRVLYNYKPQQKDELELLAGDIVDVNFECDDGWYFGKSRLTNHYGTFPGNYVEKL